MKTVTEEVFFAVIGPQNVHPRVDVRSLKHRWHVSHWEHRDTRQRVGRSETDSHSAQPTRFFLDS